MRLNGVSLVVCAPLFAACAPDVANDVSDNTDEIIRGKEEKKLPQVVFVRVNGFSGGWTLCTGTYFASRVVVTAAHCRRNDAIPGQTFVYYGTHYDADVAALPNIPAPGQPSVWARVVLVLEDGGERTKQSGAIRVMRTACHADPSRPPSSPPSP